MTPAALRCLRAELAQAQRAIRTDKPGIQDEDWRAASAVLAVLERQAMPILPSGGADLRDADQRIIVIHASRHSIAAIDGDVRIGCERRPIAEWMEKFEAIGTKQGYTPAQIQEYGLHLRHIAALVAIPWKSEEKKEQP